MADLTERRHSVGINPIRQVKSLSVGPREFQDCATGPGGLLYERELAA
jgi:hypothetical protein